MWQVVVRGLAYVFFNAWTTIYGDTTSLRASACVRCLLHALLTHARGHCSAPILTQIDGGREGVLFLSNKLASKTPLNASKPFSIAYSARTTRRDASFTFGLVSLRSGPERWLVNRAVE